MQFIVSRRGVEDERDERPIEKQQKNLAFFCIGCYAYL